MRFIYLLLIRYLHAPLLYPEGLVVLRDHTNCVCGVATTMYRREQGILAGSLIVETTGTPWERFVRRHIRDSLTREKGLRLSIELPNRELAPCEGFLVKGSNED